MTAPVVAPGRVPGLGHLPRLVRDPFGFFVSLADVGEVVTILIGRKPVHLITTPRLVRSVLLAGGDVFRRGRVFEKAAKTFGGGVIVAEGEAHRRQRRLMQPAFGRHRIASYVPEMRDAVERGVAKWRPGTLLDIPRVTHEMAVDALVHALFKADLADGAAERIMAAFPGVVSGIMAHTLYPADWMERLPLGVNRRYQKSSDEVRTIVDEVIERTGGSDAGLVGLLRKAHEDGSAFDGDLLRDEVVTLLIAGSETVATTLAWVLYESPPPPRWSSTPIGGSTKTSPATPPPPSSRSESAGTGAPVTRSPGPSWASGSPRSCGNGAWSTGPGRRSGSCRW
jgi:cytochrome P450